MGLRDFWRKEAEKIKDKSAALGGMQNILNTDHLNPEKKDKIARYYYMYADCGSFIDLVEIAPEEGQKVTKNFILIYSTAEAMNEDVTRSIDLVADRLKTMTPNYYGLTYEQMMDRAHWIYGEGGGYYALHYAYAIQNAANKIKDEDGLYKQLMSAKKGALDKAKYLTKGEQYYTTGEVVLYETAEGSGVYKPPKINENCINFNKRRMDYPKAINSNIRMALCIGAVIRTMQHPKDSIVGECNNWRGGSKEAFQAGTLRAEYFGKSTGPTKTSYHLFLQYGKTYPGPGEEIAEEQFPIYKEMMESIPHVNKKY